MRDRMRVLLAAVLLITTPAAARADLFAAPFMGLKFGGGTSIVDLELAAGAKKFTMGAALMQIDEGLIGYEASFGYIPGYLEVEDPPFGPLVKTGSFAIDFTGSMIVTLPPQFTGGGLRPYAAAGAGFAHVQAADLLPVFQVRRTVPIGQVGGGAIGLVTNNVGLRFDYRYTRSLRTDDGTLATVGRRISFSRFTVGLFLRL
jgi:opacity protein-like surface antigen